MEIIDFLRIARRRLWLLLVVPLASGAAVAAFVLIQPTQYSASALVGAPALVGGAATNQYSGSQGVLQYVSAFEAAVKSAVILQKVSEEADVAPNQVDNGLVVTSVGTSSIMRVTYTTSDQAKAERVARLAAAETLHYLFGSQVDLAQRRVDEAQRELDDVTSQLLDISQATSSTQPDQLYLDLQRQVMSLQQQQVALQANGNSTGAAAVANQISAVKRNMQELEPKVNEYLQLTQRKSSVTAVLQGSLQTLYLARSQSDAADPDSVITMTTTHPTDRSPTLLQKVLPAIGAGLFLAVLLVAALELLHRRRTEPTPLRDGRARELEQMLSTRG